MSIILDKYVQNYGQIEGFVQYFGQKKGFVQNNGQKFLLVLWRLGLGSCIGVVDLVFLGEPCSGVPVPESRRISGSRRLEPGAIL